MKQNDEIIFEQSQYSLEDLEQFRDENGFIDLTKAGIKFSKDTREGIGNQDRVKNWVNFNGVKALIKGEAMLGEQKNYGIYAELIVEEMARKLGIPAAHYDLVKMLDENGEEKQGVLSVSVLDIENKEQLVSLNSLIGTEPDPEGEISDTTSFEFTIKRLEAELAHQEYDKDSIEKLILEYKKRTAFILATADTDKHPENIAFIVKKTPDGKEIELAPVFDSEASLLLNMERGLVDDLLQDYEAVVESTTMSDPRIAVMKDREEGGIGCPWADTLETLTEDDELYDYCSEVLGPDMNMDEVFENIERRIKAPLPENVKMFAKCVYQCRNQEFEKVLDGSFIDVYDSRIKKISREDENFMKNLDDKDFMDNFLKNLIDKGTQTLGLHELQNSPILKGPKEKNDMSKENEGDVRDDDGPNV